LQKFVAFSRNAKMEREKTSLWGLPREKYCSILPQKTERLHCEKRHRGRDCFDRRRCGCGQIRGSPGKVLRRREGKPEGVGGVGKISGREE